MTTLFERVGGAEGIARAIEIFHARLAKDDSLGDAIDREALPALAPRRAAFMAWVFGATPGDGKLEFAGVIPDVAADARPKIVAHLRAALGEVGVEQLDEVLELLARASSTDLGLPFDLVVVETGGVRAEHSPTEFLAIPIRARAQLVLSRAVSFFSRGQPVERKVALAALRASSAAKAALSSGDA